MSFLDLMPGSKTKEYKNREEGYSVRLPKDWKLVSVTGEFGHAFGDSERKKGMIAIRITSSLFENLEDFAEDLAYALENQSGYRLVSKSKIIVAGCDSKELVLDAKATLNSTELDAKIVTAVIHDIKHVRFVLLSFSVLKEDYEKMLPVYGEAKKSMRLLKP